MKWFHAADGKSAGPFDSDEIHALVREGKITPTTLAWHEGLPEWKPFSDLAGDLPTAEPVEPSESSFPPFAERDEPEHDDNRPHAYLYRRLADGSGFSLRESFARGWDTIAHRPVLTLCSLLIYVVASTGASAAGLLGTLISAPLLAGVYWINLRILRNEPATFADLLEPLKRCYLQLVLVQLLQGMVFTLLCLPFVKERKMVIAGETITGNTIDFFHSPSGWMALAVLVYLVVTLMFALPLVIDQRLRAWEAIVWSFRFTSQRFFHVLFFGLALSAFAMLGLAIFLLGALLTSAISIAALNAAYVRLVTPDDFSAPPPPSSTGATTPPGSLQ